MTPLDIYTRVATSQPRSTESCIEALTYAFAADPPSRWVWPEDDTYFSVFPIFVRAFGGRAFDAGTAYHVDNFAGVALWLPPGLHADDDALARLLELTVPVERQPSVFAVFEQMAAYHPQEPHWHLPLVGVWPEFQGLGYGSALLETVLARCDRDGTSAYLEATTSRGVRLYERLGFKPVASIPAGPEAVITPMVRRARR